MKKLFVTLYLATAITYTVAVAGERRRLRSIPQDTDDADSYQFWEYRLQNIESFPSSNHSPVAPTISPDTQIPIASPTTPPGTTAPTTSPVAPPSSSPNAPAPIALTQLPTVVTTAPVLIPTPQPSVVGTAAPSTSVSPTTIGLQLCTDNVPVTAALGPGSNPMGGFINFPTEQSLLNVVDYCLDPNEGEVHTEASYVWWEPGPLELVFTFSGTYNLRSILFWNYSGEDFDVDQITFEFFNATNISVLNYTVELRLGQNSDGSNTNPIVAETITLPDIIPTFQVSALLSATNNRLKFQNFVFLADQ
jgi:hypothetical protein